MLMEVRLLRRPAGEGVTRGGPPNSTIWKNVYATDGAVASRVSRRRGCLRGRPPQNQLDRPSDFPAAEALEQSARRDVCLVDLSCYLRYAA
jgi:hypothetical protein